MYCFGVGGGYCKSELFLCVILVGHCTSLSCYLFYSHWLHLKGKKNPPQHFSSTWTENVTRSRKDVQNHGYCVEDKTQRHEREKDNKPRSRAIQVAASLLPTAQYHLISTFSKWLFVTRLQPGSCSSRPRARYQTTKYFLMHLMISMTWIHSDTLYI